MNSNIVTLYHGTDHILKQPVFGKGKINNDYGLGFYCTKSKKLACEWAVTEDSDGFANEYELDFSDLKILNLNNVQYPILTWLTILIQNRTFDSYTQVQSASRDFLINNYNINYNDFDIIKGYRADDSYFQFAKAFLNSAITYNTLANAMYLGDLGNQYVLKSEKAFSKLHFVQSHEAPSAVWFPQKYEREVRAKEMYAESKLANIQENDILLGDIIRGRLSDEEKSFLRQGVSSGSTRSSRSDD